MNRRLAMLVLAAATAAGGLLLASPSNAQTCAERSVPEANSRAKVCVNDDGTISCGGRIGDRMVFMCA